jgi:hypothetical protein
MEEKSWKQGRVEARFEGGQGPEGAVAPYMDGYLFETSLNIYQCLRRNNPEDVIRVILSDLFCPSYHVS